MVLKIALVGWSAKWQAGQSDGLPSAEYDSFKAALAPVLADYLSLAPAGTEFKHTLFKRIPRAAARPR
jgi:hypothetical protein